MNQSQFSQEVQLLGSFIDDRLKTVVGGYFFTEEGRPTRIGQAFIAIDPRALAGNDVYLERVETLIAAMTEDPEVRLPGERRVRNAAKAIREGLMVPSDLLARIQALAGETPHA